MSGIRFIDEEEVKNKKILLRADFNISLGNANNVVDDFRIKKTLPTIEYLLENNNKLTIVSHLGNPKGHKSKFSLSPIVNKLKSLLSGYEILLGNASTLKDQTDKQIFVLENIRFYQQEYDNDPVFAKELAGLCDIFVNDAFAVCHRKHASIVGVPQFIPSYGGLLLKKEVEVLSKIIHEPTRPFVAIVGGVKEDKAKFINKLTEIADHVLIGSGLTHLFKQSPKVIFPKDFIEEQGQKYDIGPETEALFDSYIVKAKTIVWTGPMGKFEDERFRHGTDFVYAAVCDNQGAFSIVGGGDTLAAISKEEHLGSITHLSTGGGAMLEFIEYGTLPGIEALKR